MAMLVMTSVRHYTENLCSNEELNVNMQSKGAATVGDADTPTILRQLTDISELCMVREMIYTNIYTICYSLDTLSIRYFTA